MNLNKIYISTHFIRCWSFRSADTFGTPVSRAFIIIFSIIFLLASFVFYLFKIYREKVWPCFFKKKVATGPAIRRKKCTPVHCISGSVIIGSYTFIIWLLLLLRLLLLLCFEIEFKLVCFLPHITAGFYIKTFIIIIFLKIEFHFKILIPRVFFHKISDLFYRFLYNRKLIINSCTSVRLTFWRASAIFDYRLSSYVIIIIFWFHFSKIIKLFLKKLSELSWSFYNRNRFIS